MMDSEIAYTLRVNPRARRMNLTIHADGQLVVTMPRRGSEAYAYRFVRSKRAWIARTLARLARDSREVLPGGRKDYEKHRRAARAFVRTRLAHWNALYDFRVRAISIRNQRTRWGSCSRRGSLSFNYKIVHLPPHLADYVIVHELCHLKEFNHSRNFWSLMARAMPSPLALRKELKRYRLR